MGMWVLHTPGSCANTPKTGGPQANLTDGGNGGDEGGVGGANGGTNTPGTQGERTRLQKAALRANLAKILTGANAFSDDVSGVVNQIVDELNCLLSLWIGFCRPSLFGLILIFMSMHHCPPPLLYYTITLLLYLHAISPLPLGIFLLHWMCPHFPDRPECVPHVGLSLIHI